MNLSRYNFLTRVPDVVAFYAMLPTHGATLIDGHSIDADMFKRIASELLAQELVNASPELVDELILFLLVKPTSAIPEILLRALANASSYTYAHLLKGAKSNRPLRMRLQHLNLCIRNLLDKDVALPPFDIEILDCRGPWDMLYAPDGERILISCDHENVRAEQGNHLVHHRLGLPTQVDQVGEGLISIGSIYSEGLWLRRGSSFQHVAHSLPLVTCVEYQGGYLTIDYRGGIYTLTSEFAVAEKRGQLALGEVSKCRRIGDSLYVMDWTQPHMLMRLSLATLEVTRIDLGLELFLPNDILELGGHFYLIDKLQGYLFKYSADFVLKGKILALGSESGKLFDPISLRYHEKKLRVLNWLSSSLVSVDAF